MPTVTCGQCGFDIEVTRVGRNLRTRGNLVAFVLTCRNRGPNPAEIRTDNLDCAELNKAILTACQLRQV